MSKVKQKEYNNCDNMIIIIRLFLKYNAFNYTEQTFPPLNETRYF